MNLLGTSSSTSSTFMLSCTAACLDFDKIMLLVVVVLVASVTFETGTIAGMVWGGTLLGVVKVGGRAVGATFLAAADVANSWEIFALSAATAWSQAIL